MLEIKRIIDSDSACQLPEGILIKFGGPQTDPASSGRGKKRWRSSLLRMSSVGFRLPSNCVEAKRRCRVVEAGGWTESQIAYL